jgi:hypothetical protein
MTHRIEPLHQIFPEKKDSTISSVVVLPDKLEFETQNPNERVFILLRRHVITNLGWICTLFVFCIIPVVTFIILTVLEIDVAGELGLKQSYIFGVLVLWYMLVITNAFMKFLDWYFNIYVITNERILDFDFSPFAYHKISEAGLDSIVDATQENIGFFPMLFNYGDVYIQTAGEKREFDFNSVAKPSWVRDKIMDLRDLVVKEAK